ncbi:MAG: hypothetical protein ABI076_13005 [Acidobacteriaceae bacterium]
MLLLEPELLLPLEAVLLPVDVLADALVLEEEETVAGASDLLPESDLPPSVGDDELDLFSDLLVASAEDVALLPDLA